MSLKLPLHSGPEPLPLEPLHRLMILGWVHALARQGIDGIAASQAMSPQEDYRLGAYLFLSWSFDHGWKP